MSTANSTDQTNPARDEFNADRERLSGERRMKMGRTQEAMEGYRKFVVGKASSGNKSKYDQVQQGCIGLSTESGELLDILKKTMCQERDFDEVNAKEECGDMLFYMTVLLHALDSNIFECIALNMKKLTTRYGDGRFDKDKSLNRDLDVERVVLEGTFQDCDSCAVTDCNIKSPDDAPCLLFKDNRNYPVEPVAQSETTEKVACCSNCAVKLMLKGCTGDARTNDDNCCVDHKFL